MTERVRTIPTDEITGGALREWHVVEIACAHCAHGRVMRHEVLKHRDRASRKLSELRFRCHRCKATTDHHVAVIVLPRNF